MVLLTNSIYGVRNFDYYRQIFFEYESKGYKTPYAMWQKEVYQPLRDYIEYQWALIDKKLTKRFKSNNKNDKDDKKYTTSLKEKYGKTFTYTKGRNTFTTNYAPDYVIRLLDYYIRVQNILRIKSGGRDKMKETDNIEIKEVNKIQDDTAAKNASGYYEESSIVAEGTGIYDATGGANALDMSSYENKTIEDYLNLPEGERVELIDGIFYDMAAPSIKHQLISFDLTCYLRNFIDENNGGCIPLVSPVDVQLDCDDKTIVQPDVMVLCDRNKLTKERIIGAPDLIVEVLSPSNWYNDTTRKLLKYKKAGIREYWIVMPENLKVLVYFFEKSDLPVEYSFKDEVPVNIWEGKCKIDFNMIYEKIKDMP